MGRKLKSNSKKRNIKEKSRFTLQKRKELCILADKVLKLTTVFQSTGTPTKSWEHHLELEKLINEIINIEKLLIHNEERQRKQYIDTFILWLKENGTNFNGIEISEFEEFELGLKAINKFSEGSLMLTIPTKLMMSEKNAEDSDLQTYIKADPLLQNMPNISLALVLLSEKVNPDSFWKPYIDILPEKYSTVLYYNSNELLELQPSPAFEPSLKLYRSIARQYAHFYNKIYNLDIPELSKLQDIYTFENYRWAVSTVMTRQNNVQIADSPSIAFIPFWDMCNHENGKITTDFNKELNRGECYALRDFAPGEQIFIFYGARSNADLFLHNGFICKQNEYDSLGLALGVSSSDPLKKMKRGLLAKLGLTGVTHYNLYIGPNPISAELLAFIRVFNMNEEELTKWSEINMPSDLVSCDEASSEAVGVDVDRRAYTYLQIRCGLIKSSYKKTDSDPDTLHRKNIKLLKECEVQILNNAIEYLKMNLQKLPTENP